jgi:trigger factor
LKKQSFFTVKREDIEGRRALLTVEFDEAQIQERVNQTAKSMAKRVRLPGYRPGKAPVRAMLRYLGEDAVREELVEQIVKEIYLDVLKEAEVEPAARGEVQVVELKPMKLVFRVPLEPAVKLDEGYKDVHIEKAKVEVEEEMVDKAIEDIRENSAQWVPLEEDAAAPGDKITVNLKVYADGEEVLNQEELEFVLEEGGLFRQEFVDEVVGMKVGDTREFKITYPDDAKVPWAGKEATFQVELLSVNRKEVPEVNDEFARELGDFETVDDLKQHLRNSFEQELSAQAENEFTDEALKALLEHAEIEYPEEMLEEEIDHLVSRRKKEITSVGWDWDSFLRISGKDEEGYRESLRDDARRLLEERLALKEFGKLEGIEVTDDEIDERIKAFMESSKEPDKLKRLYQEEEFREAVGEDILVEKALDRWLKMVAGEPLEAEEEESAAKEEEKQEEK